MFLQFKSLEYKLIKNAMKFMKVIDTGKHLSDTEFI